MPNGNRASVDIQLVAVNTKFALACQDLSAEGFVDFETINLIQT